MATAKRVKVFDFTDSAEWTVSGDCEVASDVLTLADPYFALPWDDDHWSGTYATDGSGDILLAAGVTCHALDAADPAVQLDFVDGMFDFWIKENASPTAGDTVHMLLRYNDLTDVKIRTQLYPDAAGNVRGRVAQDDGAIVAEDYKTGQDFGVWTWRHLFVRFIEDEVKVRVGTLRSVEHREITFEETGTVGFNIEGASQRWTLGGGSGGSKDAPAVNYRRRGACELKAANSWTIPRLATALGTLSPVYAMNYAPGGTDPGALTSFAIHLQYKVTGGSWTDVPADGDMSNVTFTAATTTLLVRVNDGNGYGIDNREDPRYTPELSGLVLTYTVTTPDYSDEDEIREVLVSLKAALNGDATLQAYSGWDGAEVLWPSYGTARVFRKCGVIIEPDMSPETRDAQSGGVWVKHYVHNIKLFPWMRLDRDIETMVLSDTGLLTLAADVKNALATDTLGDTVHGIEIVNTSTAVVVAGAEDEDVLPAVEIELNITSLEFEGS